MNCRINHSLFDYRLAISIFTLISWIFDEVNWVKLFGRERSAVIEKFTRILFLGCCLQICTQTLFDSWGAIICIQSISNGTRVSVIDRLNRPVCRCVSCDDELEYLIEIDKFFISLVFICPKFQGINETIRSFIIIGMLNWHKDIERVSIVKIDNTSRSTCYHSAVAVPASHMINKLCACNFFVTLSIIFCDIRNTYFFTPG